MTIGAPKTFTRTDPDVDFVARRAAAAGPAAADR
jgi:hypothetical protein